MRRLLLAPLCLLAACAGSGPARRPDPSPPRVAFGSAFEVPVPFAATPVPEAPSGQESSLASGAPEPARPVASDPARAQALAAAIVERAVQLVGIPRLGRVARGVPDDCSGLVRLAYQKAGIDLVSEGFLSGENAVTAIYRRARARGALHENPQPGDLVFFRETYDRNRDGRRNDGLTHVAVVERVEADGTLTFIHRGRKGIARSHMNLAFPRTHREGQGGSILNDILRPAARGQRAWLSGELFAGFASPAAL
ncbi:CHAP domain-containing protein [Cystobacter fuscus]|uniref:CHAP domain-containing protein n=1 Tax=Cystobacter fuscus TaxID=43 RepID=UPI0037BFB90D